METGSVISTDSDVSGMFLTKTKTKKNKKKGNDEDIDSPTARAAKALMMLNDKEDQALALV